MKASICFFFFISLFPSGRVWAREENIATITNDENQEVYVLVADTNDETDSIKTFYKDDYLSGIKTGREVVSIEGLTTDGLVLEKRGEHNVINLKSENFDLDQGGLVTIDTLYNAVNGQRKEYELQLSKSTDGWKLFKDNRVITRLHVVINKKFLIGAIGVKDIQMK